MSTKILDIDGKFREDPDFPIAVIREQEINGITKDGEKEICVIVDPVFNDSVTRNLYGRIMTLVEATTDTNRLQAVKDLFGKELSSWANDVYTSARELSNGGDSSSNIYTRLK